MREVGPFCFEVEPIPNANLKRLVQMQRYYRLRLLFVGTLPVNQSRTALFRPSRS